jgi:hypothetical protein
MYANELSLSDKAAEFGLQAASSFLRFEGDRRLGVELLRNKNTFSLGGEINLGP